MSFQSPFDQPGYSTKKKKKKKKKARKARKKATVKKAKKAKKAKKKVKERKPSGPTPRPTCPLRKRGKMLPAEVVRVTKAELEKLRKNVARPTWTDMLPVNKRKVFTYKGRRYFPIYSLLYMLSAVEVEKGFKPHKLKRGELAKAPRIQFVQRGSLIDV